MPGSHKDLLHIQHAGYNITTASFSSRPGGYKGAIDRKNFLCIANYPFGPIFSILFAYLPLTFSPDFKSIKFLAKCTISKQGFFCSDISRVKSDVKKICNLISQAFELLAMGSITTLLLLTIVSQIASGEVALVIGGFGASDSVQVVTKDGTCNGDSSTPSIPKAPDGRFGWTAQYVEGKVIVCGGAKNDFYRYG